MKLFKENFAFFAKIEKEGYRFKRNEDLKLTLEKMVSLFRNASKETLVTDVTALGTNFVAELERLQLNIANRVKSFYLVTKLRDLSFQNAQTVGLLYETCLEKHFTP